MEKNGEIRIKSVNITGGDTYRLTYCIEKENKTFELYYEVDPAYGQYFCELADSPIITFLSYAMRGGYDIVSDVPVSERLYYQFTEHLVPQFFSATPDVYPTKLTCDIVSPNYEPTEVAMAMSCGLDSLTGFYKAKENAKLPGYKATLLTFFQNGAHHMGTIGHDEREPKVFAEQLVHVKAFCERINMPLLGVHSNLDAILSDLFWKDSYESTHSFRNAGFVLLFQKLIKTYYYGATYTIAEFNGSLRNGDSAAFDIFLFANVSTANTTVYVTESKLTRIEKVLYLDQFPEVRDSLLVCYKGAENCGVCVKCRRTQVELDCAGVLEKYGKRFDLQVYQKRRREFMIRCLMKKNYNPVYKDIYDYTKKEKLRIPAYWYAVSALAGVVYNAVLYYNAHLKKHKDTKN